MTSMIELILSKPKILYSQGSLAVNVPYSWTNNNPWGSLEHDQDLDLMVCLFA